MNVTGIIAEYNPFHNGHAFHIEETRKNTDADYCIAVISGDFVQRGAPALLNKYDRAKMALENGIDLVIELPVITATSSAENFAQGGVCLLNALGVVSQISFGAEANTASDVDLLGRLADFFAFEPPIFQEYLDRALKSGCSFPAARAKAALTCLQQAKHHSMDSQTLAQFEQLLASPNNILAIEYMKALRKTGSPIKPIAIRRTGAGYHSMETTAGFQSATAIRHQLSDGTLNPSECIAGLDIPDTSKVLLQSYLTHRPILTSNDFSDVLAAQLLDVHTDLTEYVDISSDLANRIDSFRYQFLSTEQFITLLSARNLTSTRIARCLFHIILDHRRNYLDTWRNHQYAGFLRILGFRKQSGAIWKFFQPSVRAQLITQTSQAYDHLTGIGLDIYNADLHASRLYRQILKCRSQSFLPDITSEPVIILP